MSEVKGYGTSNDQNVPELLNTKTIRNEKGAVSWGAVFVQLIDADNY